jgi:DNA-directed RNA polymerase specialized sigma24 family protein
VTSSPADDGAVVETPRSSDEAALADLYVRWAPLVYSLALQSLGGGAVAEEVTRGVFHRAWLARDAPGSAQTPLDRLVDLACEGIAQARGTSEPSTGPFLTTNSGNSPRDESKTSVLAERLVVADGVSHLSALSQQMLRMSLDQHLTLPEIAGRTGVPVEEVRSEVARSLIELRLRLKEEQADAH